jgi:hypothetical protein
MSASTSPITRHELKIDGVSYFLPIKMDSKTPLPDVTPPPSPAITLGPAPLPMPARAAVPVILALSPAPLPTPAPDRNNLLTTLRERDAKLVLQMERINVERKLIQDAMDDIPVYQYPSATPYVLRRNKENEAIF